MIPNYYGAEKVYDEQMRDERREIAAHQMLRSAGLPRRRGVRQTGARLLCGLADLLMSAGQTLKQRAQADALYFGEAPAQLSE